MRGPSSPASVRPAFFLQWHVHLVSAFPTNSCLFLHIIACPLLLASFFLFCWYFRHVCVYIWVCVCVCASVCVCVFVCVCVCASLYVVVVEYQELEDGENDPSANFEMSASL